MLPTSIEYGMTIAKNGVHTIIVNGVSVANAPYAATGCQPQRFCARFAPAAIAESKR